MIHQTPQITISHLTFFPFSTLTPLSLKQLNPIIRNPKNTNRNRSNHNTNPRNPKPPRHNTIRNTTSIKTHHPINKQRRPNPSNNRINPVKPHRHFIKHLACNFRIPFPRPRKRPNILQQTRNLGQD
ncbi:hypothetical protein HanIR_Chr15g0745381 [Helianthus annuus]|nr:hypothetical protein HanIR_Chr15g0745381 [Helianthus annuus]